MQPEWLFQTQTKCPGTQVTPCSAGVGSKSVPAFALSAFAGKYGVWRSFRKLLQKAALCFLDHSSVKNVKEEGWINYSTVTGKYLGILVLFFQGIKIKIKIADFNGT